MTRKTPSDWTYENIWDLPHHDRRRMKRMNIEFGEPVYRELPEKAATGIERVLKGGPYESSLEEVRRYDDETLELIYYGDGETKFREHRAEKVEKCVQDWFGPLWQMRRKPDDRRGDGENIQRFFLRRLSARRFRYPDDEDAEWDRIVYGTPDGVPESAAHWGDIESYPSARDDGLDHRLDTFVYTSGTGTRHLIKAKGYEGLLTNSVARGVETMCSRTVSAETLAEGSAVKHYGQHAAEAQPDEFSTDSLDPQSVFGDSLCRSCWKQYAVPQTETEWVDGEQKTKTVGFEAPNVAYRSLADWGRDL